MTGIFTPRVELFPWAYGHAVRARQAAAQELRQIGAGEPVIAQRFDIRHGDPNLLLPDPQELKDAQLHGVILQLGLTHDALEPRQENVSGIARTVLSPLHPLRNRPDRGANSNAQRVVFLLGAAQLCPCKAGATLPLIKERNRKLE